ncbi:TPA: acyl carrier protein [Escherichia coli]|nr:acyl carrier protein [Escherichia coli]HBA9522829.1 acyl carrier protein [Escherichia coli]HBA9550885.1 acyl carrier protein [Escherichia coli]HBA9560263.1 acyl carrier protein [Escherichia coli]
MNYDEGMGLVCTVISLVNSTQIENIKATDRLIIELKMDSIELTDLLLQLEEYNVVFTEEQITSQLTVGDVVNALLSANREI